MKRSEFINKSSLGFSSLALIPVSFWSINLSDNSCLSLKVNKHIRHGSYGSDYISNKVLNSFFSEIRIDHFLNDSGDMLLYEFHAHKMRLRIGLTENQVFIHHNNQQLEHTMGYSGLIWEDLNSEFIIEVLNNGDTFEKKDRNLLVLKGACNVSGVPFAAPILLPSQKDQRTVTSIGQTIMLDFAELPSQLI